jgi:hypothetical protein
VGLYARVSSHDQQTLPRQLSAMREDAKKRNWTVAVEVKNVGSGATTRPELVEGDGGPLGMVIAGANVVDQKLLEATIEAIVVERPDPEAVEQHLSLDKGYDNPHRA